MTGHLGPAAAPAAALAAAPDAAPAAALAAATAAALAAAPAVAAAALAAASAAAALKLVAVAGSGPAAARVWPAAADAAPQLLTGLEQLPAWPSPPVSPSPSAPASTSCRPSAPRSSRCRRRCRHPRRHRYRTLRGPISPNISLVKSSLSSRPGQTCRQLAAPMTVSALAGCSLLYTSVRYFTSRISARAASSTAKMYCTRR